MKRPSHVRALPSKPVHRSKLNACLEQESELPVRAKHVIQRFVSYNLRCASCAVRLSDKSMSILCLLCKWKARFDGYFTCGYCPRADRTVKLRMTPSKLSHHRDLRKSVTFVCGSCTPGLESSNINKHSIEMCCVFRRNNVYPTDMYDTKLSDALQMAADSLLMSKSHDFQSGSVVVVQSPTTHEYHQHRVYLQSRNFQSRVP